MKAFSLLIIAAVCAATIASLFNDVPAHETMLTALNQVAGGFVMYCLMKAFKE